MKKVVVLSTGGTIASVPGHDGRNIAGALKGNALLSHVQVADDIELEVISVFQKPSNSITRADLLSLYKQCQDLIDTGDVAGIVITHGTDTLEDTAYFLECTLQQKNTAVVITGSQRVPHAPGTDAYVNLQHAIQAAASDTCKNIGVLIVFNQNIFAASLARKTSSYQLNGFSAPGFGCLGFIDGDDVLIYQQPRKQAVLAPVNVSLPQVDILSVYMESSPIALDALVASDISAIVIDGIGRGQVPPTWLAGIKRGIDAGKKILITSSTLTGPVAPCYEYPAALFELEQIGAIGVSGLNARKARLRLMLILAIYGQQVSAEKILELFVWGVLSAG